MKSIIKRDLKRNQLDFGVFEADTWTGDDEATPVPSISKSFSSGAIKGQSGHSRRGTNASDAAQEEEEEEDEEEPESTDPPPKLIKLTRSLSLSTKLSSARHRPGTRSISKLAEAAALETRWNGASEDSAELEESLPFSLVAADFVESTAPTGGAMRYERKFASVFVLPFDAFVLTRFRLQLRYYRHPGWSAHGFHASAQRHPGQTTQGAPFTTRFPYSG